MLRPYVFQLMTTLYLVPTPLGNPDDISLRALRILREVSVIAAPDASSVQLLLDHHLIATPVIADSGALAALSAGDVALVGTAGTPGLGGAAHAIVRAALAQGLRVESLPGASAEITALVLSGLPTDAFVYGGALPDDLSAYAAEPTTLIFRCRDVVPALERLRAALGDRSAAAAVALTQPGEIVFRGQLSEAAAYFGAQAAPPADALLVVAGARAAVPEAWDEDRVRAALRARLGADEPLKAAAKAVAAEAGWDRRTVYALGVEEKRNTP